MLFLLPRFNDDKVISPARRLDHFAVPILIREIFFSFAVGTFKIEVTFKIILSRIAGYLSIPERRYRCAFDKYLSRPLDRSHTETTEKKLSST